MPSNEHPDMSGNPADAPLICDWCGDPIPYDGPYGCESNEDKVFCCEGCAFSYDEEAFQKE